MLVALLSLFSFAQWELFHQIVTGGHTISKSKKCNNVILLIITDLGDLLSNLPMKLKLKGFGASFHGSEIR